MDITKLIPQFRAADFGAFIDDYTMGDLVYKNYFPSLYTPMLTFEALKAEFGAKVAADVVAFDSRAPRKGRPTPGKITGDIPKIEIARVKQESDLNQYRMLLASVQQAVNASVRAQAMRRLIDWMYEDGKFCLDGVNARLEWLAKQAISNGKYSLNITNNAGGIVTKVDIDFGVPSANRANAAVDWSTTATAKPITDIKNRQKAARAKGYRLSFAWMEQDTFDKMAATEEVQKAAASYVAISLDMQVTPSVEAVNRALSGMGLPQIIIWDNYMDVESKAGSHTTVSGWEEGNVAFTRERIIGDTWNTTTADGFVTIDESTKAYNDFVLVKAFAEQDPITVVTKGVAYATPVLRGANHIHILKTKLS